MDTKVRSLIAVVAGGLLVFAGILFLASGGVSDTESGDHATETTVRSDERGDAEPQTDTSGDGAAIRVDPVDPDSVYDPVRAGEDTPPTYRQLLGRDQIAPIYDPTFTSADDADWPLDVLVVGVEGPATAKAYPVSHLNRHEMVIDHIDGDPILVTW